MRRLIWQEPLRRSGRDGTRKDLRAEALQSGWTGKLWLCSKGMASCEETRRSILVYRRDIRAYSPDTLARLGVAGEQLRLDLVSLMVLLQAKSFAERLLIPPFPLLFLKLYPPRWIADTKATDGGRCGRLRPAAANGAGAHWRICGDRAEVIDDCALARAVKRSGGAIWMGLTRKA